MPRPPTPHPRRRRRPHRHRPRARARLAPPARPPRPSAHRLVLAALNPAVTQATIAATICAGGWTDTIRPSAAYTEQLKKAQLAAAHLPNQRPSAYEEDHIIPLELGGAPANPANLRPVPLTRATRDDRLENTLHDAVCSGAMTLATAQTKIAAAKAGEPLSAVPTTSPAGPPSTTRSPAPPPSQPATTPPRSTAAPNGATALCRDGSLSFAAHHQGACSHHGGVAQWYR
ncbi:DUF3761 domain-containing protein [Streptacidiphilus monticola]